MEKNKNKNKDVQDFIESIINSLFQKVFTTIEETERINQEKTDADIKFNTLNLDDIISQANNSINIFSSFDILSNSFLNFEESQSKKEPVEIKNIEELLLNEESITEIIYTYDKRYKDCFNETNMIKLIDYSTHMAYISDDDIMTHKHPFYACELLKCDAPYIYEKFFNNEKIMAYFFEFLNDEKNRSNNVLSGYFAKIFLSLLDKNNDVIINFIFKEENLYIEQIIELCEHSSYCECIKYLLTLQSDKHDEKKLFILKKLNKLLFRREEYTNKICFEIYSSLLEEGNLVFCNFFLRNFEKIFEEYDYNYKSKKVNFELFGYYIHLVRVIKECFTREKESNVEIDLTQIVRKELNNYVIQNKKIFLDFEINLLDSTTSIIFIKNSTEDNIENITYRRIIVAYLDILDYILFTVSIKYNEKEFKYYISKIHDIFTNNILIKITNVIFKYPLFNMLQVSYINLISTLSKINSPLLNNDTIINNCVDYLIHENTEKDILISFLVKVLDIIYKSLKEQNISFNKKLKFIYEFVIKNIMDIFESKLLFNHEYGTPEKNLGDINNKNIDEIDNLNIDNINQVSTVKNKNMRNVDNNIINDENENENKNSYVFKDVVNKGIYDYIIKTRFCNSSKNLTSVDNISEEIDLDDINDDDIDDNNLNKDNNINNNNKNHKQFTLTSFDELDDDESNNNESIGEIFKQTAEMIKSIKMRNKIKDNKDSFKKKILDNIIIEEKNENKNNKNEKEEEINTNINTNTNINNNSINDINTQKKKSKTLNKFNSKSKSSFSIGMDNRNNSLPVIISKNFNSEKTNKNKNKEKLDNINSNINNIFEYNKPQTNKNDIKVLPNIKINIKEQNPGRYFYNHDIGKKMHNQNNGDRINNFRSNNIIKMKENKENSFFNNLKRSSDNSTNFKYCINFFHKDSFDKNKNDKNDKK